MKQVKTKQLSDKENSNNEPDYEYMSIEDIWKQFTVETGIPVRDVTAENEGKTYLMFLQKPKQDSQAPQGQTPQTPPPQPPTPEDEDDWPITMDYLM